MDPALTEVKYFSIHVNTIREIILWIFNLKEKKMQIEIRKYIYFRVESLLDKKICKENCVIFKVITLPEKRQLLSLFRRHTNVYVFSRFSHLLHLPTLLKSKAKTSLFLGGLSDAQRNWLRYVFFDWTLLFYDPNQKPSVFRDLEERKTFHDYCNFSRLQL
jgi:hypothetical protein